MIKLTDLLPESVALPESEKSNAAQQAEKLGLVSKGWGNWADPQTGEVVAKTIHGHLVKVDKERGSNQRSDQERAYMDGENGENKKFNSGWGRYHRKLGTTNLPDEEPEWVKKQSDPSTFHPNLKWDYDRDYRRANLYPGYDPGDVNDFWDDPKQ